MKHNGNYAKKMRFHSTKLRRKLKRAISLAFTTLSPNYYLHSYPPLVFSTYRIFILTIR